jgi:predicted DNA-binding transcriptional regulator AlpA
MRERYGISDMTIWRWLNNPVLNFPKPLIVNRRRYWRHAEIEAWERAQAASRSPADATASLQRARRTDAA